MNVNICFLTAKRKHYSTALFIIFLYTLPQIVLSHIHFSKDHYGKVY